MSTFTWNNFGEDFITSIVYSEKTQSALKPPRKITDKDMLIPTMERIAPYPTKDFVITYRAEIESKLFIGYPELIGKIYKDISGHSMTNYRSMLNELSKLELGSALLGRYISAISYIGNPGYEYESVSMFAQPITIDLTKSIANEVPLYDFQKDAIGALRDRFLTKDENSGMLVMPTGSGKTRVAACFLLQNMVSKGYQVIWLTHRHMLIDQTASAFYSFAPLAKLGNRKTTQLKITCVSGEHASIRATDKDDNIMIISVQSGFRNLDYFKTVLSKKIIIVVDEAHHTVAMSYRRIIDYIRSKRKNAKLLGLTATPIRGTDSESIYLIKLFQNNLIYSISMAELIKKQILAIPEFERIQTDSNFEPLISIDEAKLIKKYGELPATLADKIAHSSKRNEIIVNTYMQNRKRYGKTLIFALNSFHCYTLCHELVKRGVKCDYIYSGNKDNEEKIRRFKDNELDVLININILTEGSDVPDIQTIFLTRPTQSEGLLIQMIGRGLRGKLAGGTDKAIIVDFCDKWDIFNKWVNPEWFFDEIEEPDPQPKSESTKSKELVKTPWKLVGDIYKNISYSCYTPGISQQKLPLGWYPLVDMDGNDYTLIVWQDQLSGFTNMIRDKKEIINNLLVTPQEIINKYFGGFNTIPTLQDIDIFLYNLKSNDMTPRMFKFEHRNRIEPYQVAKNLLKENIGIADLNNEIKNIYKANETIITDVYQDFEIYYTRILENIVHHNGQPPLDVKIVEIPVQLLPYKIEPTHDLDKLTEEVIDEIFQGEYPGISSVEWTDKPYTRYYGVYFSGGIIRINKMLDSPEVDKEVVKFIIYHELLHRDYKKHDKAFYREEHKYPNYTEHNRFLDHRIYNYKMEM